MIAVRRYLITGRVQGVGFRVFTEEAALREGLTGFVRNLADGRVEAIAEGEKAAIAKFEGAIRLGPPLAKVDDLFVEDLPLGQLALGFEIHA